MVCELAGGTRAASVNAARHAQIADESCCGPGPEPDTCCLTTLPDGTQLRADYRWQDGSGQPIPTTGQGVSATIALTGNLVETVFGDVEQEQSVTVNATIPAGTDADSQSCRLMDARSSGTATGGYMGTQYWPNGTVQQTFAATAQSATTNASIALHPARVVPTSGPESWDGPWNAVAIRFSVAGVRTAPLPTLPGAFVAGGLAWIVADPATGEWCGFVEMRGGFGVRQGTYAATSISVSADGSSGSMTFDLARVVNLPSSTVLTYTGSLTVTWGAAIAPTQCPGWPTRPAYTIGTCDTPGEPPNPQPPVNPICCDPPSASGWAFLPNTTHLHSARWRISQYLPGGGRLRRRWSGDFIAPLNAPALQSDCRASQSGATLASPPGLGQSTFEDFPTASGIGTLTNAFFRLNAFAGEDAANGASGSRLELEVRQGAASNSTLLFSLVLRSSDAPNTLTTRTGVIGGMTLNTTTGRFQGSPAGSVPFWTGFSMALTSQSLQSFNGFDWTVEIEHGMAAQGYARCDELSSGLALNPALAAAREAFRRQLPGCRTCGDAGVEDLA
jgi:hypothetical protein